MNIEEIKELYSKGWIIVAKNPVEYEKINNPIFERFNGSEVAIAPQHEHILDAWLDGHEVYWESSIEEGYYKSCIGRNTHFIDNYTPNINYIALPTTLDSVIAK